MILMKLGDEYKLYSHDSCIATTQESPYKRLSKQNCDEIFGAIDVEKLSEEEYPKTSSWRVEEEFEPIRRGYLKGYNKAVELNKDKLFTEEQMWNMFYFGDSLKIKIKSGNIDNKPMGEIFDDYIKSLQQPTEIEVRIAMRCSLPNGCTEPEVECTCEPTYNLDKNGCLTLWVLKI